MCENHRSIRQDSVEATATETSRIVRTWSGRSAPLAAAPTVPCQSHTRSHRPRQSQPNPWITRQSPLPGMSHAAEHESHPPANQAVRIGPAFTPVYPLPRSRPTENGNPKPDMPIPRLAANLAGGDTANDPGWGDWEIRITSLQRGRMSKMTIRPFTGMDLKEVLAVWNRALKKDPMTEGRFVRWALADPDYWPGDDSGFFVALQDDRLVGFLRAIIRRMPNDRAGLEPELGWIPVVAVDPPCRRHGIGFALLESALAWFRKHGRRRIWVCGNSGSAPGYVFPGVDKDDYPGGLALFAKAGFRVHRGSVAMSREVVNFDIDEYRRQAWETGKDVRISTLHPEQVPDFFTLLSEAFPGDWNTAARAKIRAGLLHEVLVATADGRIVGYCQWEGEHFGPFGVRAEYRNRRIGAKLFVEAVQKIREADGRTVWFNWAEDDAARFYGRFGLTATRRYCIFVKEL